MAEDKELIQTLRINFSKYEPPIFKETKNGSLYLYGKNANDLYPDYLIGLYEKSPTHKACIDTKHRFVFGGGWEVDTTAMTQGEADMYRAMLNSINEDEETLNDVTGKNGWDYLIPGAFAIEVIYYKTNRKKWEFLNFVPISQIRPFKTESGKLKYCFLPDWKGVTKYEVAKEKEGFREWWPFGSQKNPEESELFYIKTERPLRSGESGVFALPSYSGSIPWIEVDSRTGVFHLNNIRNNWSAGSILNFYNGEPSKERKDEILAELKKHYAGENAEETGGVMAVFNKPGSEGVKMDRQSAGDQDKLYLQVDDFARQKVVTANNVPLSLLNIPVSGVVFERNTKEDDEIQFTSTYVKPTQKIFERAVNHLMKFNGLKPVFRLKTVSMYSVNDKIKDNDAKTLQMLKSANPVLAAKFVESLDENEVRALFGREPKVVTPTTSTTVIQRQDFGANDNIHDFVFDVSDTANTDEDFRTLHMAKTLDVDLLGFDGDMVALVHKNPTISTEALAVALKKPADKVEARLTSLIEAGVFTGKIGDLKISKLAQAKIKEEDIALDIQVRYFYEGPDDDRVRDWCRKRLDNQPKQGYTFEQVQALKPSEANWDDNNFNNRGGWWTHKDGSITTYCRHKWVAKTIRVKG